MAHKKKLTPFQEFEQAIREADASIDEAPFVDETTAIDEAKVQRVGDGAPSNLNKTKRVQRAGLTEASLPEIGPTDDDLAPETLIHEDGALSPLEAGDDVPADRSYRIASATEVGAGFGLDEAELARVDPLDGEPWEDDEQSDNNKQSDGDEP